MDALVRCAWADPLSSLLGAPSRARLLQTACFLGAVWVPHFNTFQIGRARDEANIAVTDGFHADTFFPLTDLLLSVARPFYRIGQIEILRNRFESAEKHLADLASRFEMQSALDQHYERRGDARSIMIATPSDCNL